MQNQQPASTQTSSLECTFKMYDEMAVHLFTISARLTSHMYGERNTVQGNILCDILEKITKQDACSRSEVTSLIKEYSYTLETPSHKKFALSLISSLTAHYVAVTSIVRNEAADIQE